MKMTPRRSVLYMPASNTRALEKAKTIAADALIFDLEDAVAPDAKPAARDQAAAAVASGEYGRREITIRCNGLDTPWGADDISAASAAGPAAVVIPKVSGPDHLGAVADLLEKSDAPDHTTIWAMVETPEGIMRASEIAAFERMSVMVMGTNDMAKELRAQISPGRSGLVPHLATCLLAVRRHGKMALDGVYNDVRDLEGFEQECVQGWEMGFDGKTLIHPGQVEPTNRIWSPTEQDIEHSRRIIKAFQEAEAKGKGVVTVDGQMIENLHVENARRVLAVADVIATIGDT